MGSEPVTVICTCCEGCSCMGCPGHGRAELAAVFRRAHAAERETQALREGLRYLGYAMRDGDCRRIRDRWGGSTPEDWCGEADALHRVLTEWHAAERRAAVLAALLGCAGEVLLEVRRVRDERRPRSRPPSDQWPIPDDRAIVLLATAPRTLMRLIPETTVIIETALGAAGLTIENLEERD